MQLRKAERRQAKIKLAIQGASGSGKTFSALLLSKGLVDNWSKVAVVDTENSSADLYAHLGDFNVLPLESPFSPERYIKAIDTCVKAGVKVIILDSISHCWDYLLDQHARLQGNSFTNWAKITPRHRTFLEKILQTDIHIIATMRTKQDYVLNQKDGKFVPEKIGLKAVQRDGVDYEFTIVFDLDLHHNCKASKDRTGIFMDQAEFVISGDTGKQIRAWCEEGTSVDEVRTLIHQCQSMEELKLLYQQYTTMFSLLQTDFNQRKAVITGNHLQTTK